MNSITLKKRKTFSRKTTQYHHYYRRKGVYEFLFKNLYKLLIGLGLLMGLILGFQFAFPDFNVTFLAFLNDVPDIPVISLFFISESFLGLIPPDLFIIWAQKFSQPYWMVFGLAVLSYLGGLVSYFIGKYIGHIAFLERMLLPVIQKQKALINQFGGIIIIFAALFPLPFSPICMVAGAVDYQFFPFVRLALFRFLRFFAYAMVLFQVF